jgi:hypothetical protein
MREQLKQQNSGKIIQTIVEKLLPWHRIKWLGVGELSQTVRIHVLGIDVKVGICADESFQVQSLEPNPSPEDENHTRRLQAILNGEKRDDAGNLPHMVCGLDKSDGKPPYSVLAAGSLPDPGEGYRLLIGGEELKPGDEFWESGRWGLSVRAINGLTVQRAANIYRRKTETKPTEWIPGVGDRVRVASNAPVFAGCDGHIKDVSTQGSFTIYFISEDKMRYGWLNPEHLELIEAAK